MLAGTGALAARLYVSAKVLAASMIERKTALILGAGASMPYGFPTGVALHQIMMGWRNDSEEFHNVTSTLGCSSADLQEFLEAFRKSGRTTIDRFLEHRQEFRELGKYLIAYVLMQLETDQGLYDEPPTARKNEPKRWYQYFYNEIMDSSSIENFKRNQLAVITFNYDRSFEQFLSNALIEGFRITPEEADEVLDHIPLYHVYGHLGGPDGLSGYDGTHEFLGDVAESLLSISDSVSDQKLLGGIRGSIIDAEVVACMGFGYDPINMKVIGLDRIDQVSAFSREYPDTEVYGTTFQIPQSKLTRDIEPRFLTTVPELFDLDCYNFLVQKGEIFRRTGWD